MNARAGLAPSITEEFKDILGDRFSTSRYDLESHGVDDSYRPVAGARK